MSPFSCLLFLNVGGDKKPPGQFGLSPKGNGLPVDWPLQVAKKVEHLKKTDRRIKAKSEDIT